MKTRSVSLAILFTCLLQACTKSGGNEKFTISGRIYLSCTSTPMSNKELSFFQTVGGGGPVQTSGGQLGTTTTDANGDFSFTYKPANANEVKIQSPAGFGYSTIITGLPGKKNIENIVVRYGPTTTVQVRLNVAKSYTSADTLYFTNFERPTQPQKVAGPFVAGATYNLNHGIHIPDYNEDFNTENFSYKLNSQNWVIKKIKLVACDTSRVTADIN